MGIIVTLFLVITTVYEAIQRAREHILLAGLRPMLGTTILLKLYWMKSARHVILHYRKKVNNIILCKLLSMCSLGNILFLTVAVTQIPPFTDDYYFPNIIMLTLRVL